MGAGCVALRHAVCGVSGTLSATRFIDRLLDRLRVAAREPTRMDFMTTLLSGDKIAPFVLLEVGPGFGFGRGASDLVLAARLWAGLASDRSEENKRCRP